MFFGEAGLSFTVLNGIVPCRAGAMFAKQTCHGAKRSMLASRRNVARSIFRIQSMFALIKSLPPRGIAASGS